jgi:hypothetical protein
MADPSTQINVVAVLRRVSDSQFACLVRWVLGTNEDLPHIDDVFDVKVTLQDKDGNPQGDVTAAIVKPRLFAMLDAPRALQPLTYPGGGTDKWRVAIKPTTPVDPNDSNSGDLDGKPVGVVHILAETEQSRVEWRVASIFDQAASHQLQSFAMRDRFGPDDINASARAFATALLRSGIRPRHLQKALFDSREALVTYAATLASGAKGTAPALMQISGATLDRQFTHAALVAHVLAGKFVLNNLDATVSGAQQTRQHIRLRALHGGEMIDYWADPDSGSSTISEQDRGKRYPASELIGSGCTILLSASDLNQWVTQKFTLVVSVIQLQRNAANRSDQALRSSIPGNVLSTRIQFSDGTTSITYDMLKRAQLMGSSVPPPAPSNAYINYAMNQSDAAETPEQRFKTQGKGPVLGYGTGDGKLEIYITEPPQPDGRRSVSAYNIYGMWEGPREVQPFFDDGSANPTLDQLKHWLISRRYSYARDLMSAFPDISGTHHPKLLEILASPPWQPVLQRPDRVTDKGDGGDQTLPNLSPAGTAVFAFDLRQGMATMPGTPSDIFIGWDLGAPADTTWSPERQRDGSHLPSGSTRPQRYRFWVTSVDAFEQESAPVPVTTNDVDAGEQAGNSFFYPVRRAPLFGSPGESGADNTSLRYDADQKRFIVTFQTPWENQVSGSSGGSSTAPTRVDKHTVEATVILWRRRLTHKVKVSSMTGRFVGVSSPVPALPQWQDADVQLQKDGWMLPVVLTATMPASGDVWQAISAPLTFMDSGWEYIAGIGFSVKANVSGFWAPNVLTSSSAGRLAILNTPLPAAQAVATITGGAVSGISLTAGGSGYTTPPTVAFQGGGGSGASAVAVISKEGSVTAINITAGGTGYATAPVVSVAGVYLPSPVRVNETPGASDVMLTNSFAIPNLKIPRSPLVGVEKVWRSLPILPPPGVRRDLVLLRILTQGFSRNNQPQDPVPWRDTGLKLTLGQAAMCDTAIARTNVNGAPLKPDDDHLRMVRQLLAIGFKNQATEIALRQHMTLGFRGFLDWNWSYTPLVTTPEDVAETVRFRFLSMRVPQDPALAANFATVAATGTLVDTDQYEVQLTKGGPVGWQSIADSQSAADGNLAQPTLVSVTGVGGVPKLFGTLIATSEAGTVKRARIRLRSDDQLTPLPVKATLQFFAAQSLVELEVSKFDGPSDYSALLPIGGGDEETIAWWIAGVSAQGRMSSRKELPFVALDFPTTIEPKVPNGFRVSVPTDFQQHMLDPANSKVKPWLPTDLQTLQAAEFLPRLVLTWEAYSTDDILLTVERDQRQVASQASALRMLLIGPSPWDAIKNIEASLDAANLDAADLDAIQPNWLIGQTVDIGQAGLRSDQSWIEIGFDRGLPAMSGLKKMPSEETLPGGSHPLRPGFVDYYGRNGNMAMVMDSNWEFRYRLRAFVDLGSDIAESKWRYLQSMPTDWSSFMLPETPALCIKTGKTQAHDRKDIQVPIVRLRILPGQPPPGGCGSHAGPLSLFLPRNMRNSMDTNESWQYRVVARRRVDVPIPSTTGLPKAVVWIDVGKPTNLTTTSLDIVDDEVDRAWPGDNPTFRYKMIVQQFKVTIADGVRTEKLIRGFDVAHPNVGNCEFDLVIPLPQDPAAEAEIIQEIYVA